MQDAPDMAAGTPQAEQAQASPQKNARLRETAHTQKKASGQTPATLTPATDEPQATAATLQSPDETPWLYEGSNVPVDRQWRFGVLDNGLRYATRKNGVPPDQVSIRIRIDAGSLYETDQERGFAHLLEHLLFRQSRYLGVGETIPTWQRLGATFGNDTNAVTSPTQTVYQLDLP
ncbi:MAG: insulinase family protein, partial [Pseudomonadota bacterium]|nr:insulinase family protein [Pseudomonadota bacterium]